MIICVCLDYLVSDCIKTFAQDFCSSHWIAMNVWGTLFTCFFHQSHVKKINLIHISTFGASTGGDGDGAAVSGAAATSYFGHFISSNLWYFSRDTKMLLSWSFLRKLNKSIEPLNGNHITFFLLFQVFS